MEVHKNKLGLQFKSFSQCQNLWFGKGAFKLEQFVLDNEVNENIEFPEELDKIKIFGKRAEVFFELQLKQNENFQVLAKNIQIARKKITLGELDFLIKNLRTKEILHIELVSKFYLYDPSQDKEIDRWIGPNRKDRLHNKLNKLEQKQLPILHSKESLQMLKTIQLDPSEIRQMVCFKADLYVPRQHLKYPDINKNCIVGYWIKIEEFIPEEFDQARYFMPKKTDWNINPKHHSSWLTFEGINLEIEKSLSQGRCPLIWQKISTDQYQRFFVVNWKT